MKTFARVITKRVSAMRVAMNPGAAATAASQQQTQQSPKFSLFRRQKSNQRENRESNATQMAPQLAQNENGELKMKIAFIGETGTGAKTSFLERYLNNTFLDMPTPTIGAAFQAKTVVSRGMSVKLECGILLGKRDT